jgi:hypothetical protein
MGALIVAIVMRAVGALCVCVSLGVMFGLWWAVFALGAMLVCWSRGMIALALTQPGGAEPSSSEIAHTLAQLSRGLR